jgi:hypothetical protein
MMDPELRIRRPLAALEPFQGLPGGRAEARGEIERIVSEYRELVELFPVKRSWTTGWPKLRDTL